MQKEMRARLDSLPRTEASFVEPMECLSVSKLPEGATGYGKSNLMDIAPSRSSRQLVSRCSRGEENLSIDNFPISWTHWRICPQERSWMEN